MLLGHSARPRLGLAVEGVFQEEEEQDRRGRQRELHQLAHHCRSRIQDLANVLHQFARQSSQSCIDLRGRLIRQKNASRFQFSVLLFRPCRLCSRLLFLDCLLALSASLRAVC